MCAVLAFTLLNAARCLRLGPRELYTSCLPRIMEGEHSAEGPCLNNVLHHSRIRMVGVYETKIDQRDAWHRLPFRVHVMLKTRMRDPAGFYVALRLGYFGG